MVIQGAAGWRWRQAEGNYAEWVVGIAMKEIGWLWGITNGIWVMG